MAVEANNQPVARPRGIIFDCDGTLADTMPLHWQTWQRIARRYGLSLSRERFYSLGGIPARDILRMLSAEQGVALDPLAVAREKEAEYLELIAHVEPINVVVSVARENCGKIPLAVARRLGVPPQFCRAYEDTDVGMQAIRAAGMEAVDVRELLKPAPAS
jgi:beta-phosphoglucomutase-like phosphatase (HAD superfamily)